MGSIWDRQDPDGPHVGPMNFAIWDVVWKIVAPKIFVMFIVYGDQNMVKNIYQG